MRRAEVSDAPAMRDIVAAGVEGYRAFAPPGWEPPADLLSDVPHREIVADPEALAMVAVDADGTVVGLVSVMPDAGDADWYLRHIFVAGSAWGTGVAAALMAEAIAYGAGRPGRLVTPAGQARARRFYEREGWTCAGVSENERFGMPTAEYRFSRGPSTRTG